MTSPYRATVEQWKRDNSTVTPPMSTAFDLALKYFPPSCTSILSHPDVSKVGTTTKDKLLLLQLYKYLEFTIWTEQGLVVEVCEKMYAKNYFLKLSRDLVEGARSIHRQEKNHSRWAYALLLGVSTHTRVSPPDEQPDFFKQMDRLINDDKSMEVLIKLFFVIIAELIDFGTAEKIRQDTQVQKPVRDFADDHENEEKLHRVYFRKLFEEVWDLLPSDIKQPIGILIPDIVIAFLKPEEASIRTMLGMFPSDFPTAEEIVQDLTANVSTDIRHSAGEALSFMREYGVFDNPTIAAAFRARHLMPDDL